MLFRSPEGEQLVDTVLALVRLPNLDVPSLRHGIAGCFDLDLNVVLDNLGGRAQNVPDALVSVAQRPLPTNADVLEAFDAIAEHIALSMAAAEFSEEALRWVVPNVFWPWNPMPDGYRDLFKTVLFICRELVPNLQKVTGEVDNLLHALGGGFVPPGPSGAPTRGMAHVLPTGRNFYAVDPRALPSQAAWQVEIGRAHV